MDRYQRANAVNKVEGYYLRLHPRRTAQDEFLKAQAECLQHLREQIAHVESLTFPQFAQELKFKVGAAHE